MKVWILLLCASVLGSEKQPSTTKRLLKGALCIGCFCVAVKTCCYVLTQSQPQNGENALSCSSSQIVNVACCSVFAPLQNIVSNIATNISKKWYADKNLHNCSEDIYHIVDSDGKYVIHSNTDDYESGPKEGCTDYHSGIRQGPERVPYHLMNYKFEDHVFYRYVQAATFRKCTPNPESGAFYIMMCTHRYRVKETDGFCENYSNAIYLNRPKSIYMYGDFIHFIRDTLHVPYTGPIKFIEMQSSKDGFFYLTSDESSKQYLQWYQYELLNDGSIVLKLMFGQESEKIPFKFEKVAASNPQICKPIESTYPSFRRKYLPKKEDKEKKTEDL